MDFEKLWPSYISLPTVSIISLYVGAAVVYVSAERILDYNSVYSRGGIYIANSLAFGTLLGLFGSHVTGVFNRELPNYEPFGKDGDLLRHLRAKTYAIVTTSAILHDVLQGNKSGLKFANYNEAIKANPLTTVHSLYDFKFGETKTLGSGEAVLIGGSTSRLEMEQYYCGIQTATQWDLFIGHDTMAIAKNVRPRLKKMTQIHVELIRAGKEKIYRNYRQNPDCRKAKGVVKASVLRDVNAAEEGVEGDERMLKLVSLGQVMGPFVTFAACIVACAAILLLEQICGLVQTLRSVPIQTLRNDPSELSNQRRERRRSSNVRTDFQRRYSILDFE